MKSTRLIFSTQSYRYLQKSVCAAGGFEPGEVDVKTFPDTERYQRVLTSVDHRHVALVGGTITDADTLELYDLATGLVQNGAQTLTLVIPYFGYSTMERPVKSGEVVTAKARARLLSSLPAAIEGNRVMLLDLHSEGLPYYFEGHMRPIHVYAKAVVTAVARKMCGSDFVLACTDAGRAKWVQSLANDLQVPASFVFKRRVDGSHTEVSAVSAQVSEKPVVIYDDMIRTGSSLLNAARAYRDAGAKSVAAIATHGIFPADSLDKMKQSGLLTQIVVTDSHPRALALQCDFLKVETIAPLLADALKV